MIVKWLNVACLAFLALQLVVQSFDVTYINTGVQTNLLAFIALIPGNLHFLFATEQKREQYKREIYFFVYQPLALVGLNIAGLLMYAFSDPSIIPILLAGGVSAGLFYYQVQGYYWVEEYDNYFRSLLGRSRGKAIQKPKLEQI